jgi:hypothetical protein
MRLISCKKCFPEAEVYLDRFHQNRALNETLSFNPGLLQRAYKSLSEGDLAGLGEVLTEALSRASSER